MKNKPITKTIFETLKKILMSDAKVTGTGDVIHITDEYISDVILSRLIPYLEALRNTQYIKYSLDLKNKQIIVFIQ